VGDLERKAVRRRLLVQLAAVDRSTRSTKLLENTALVCDVFGLLMDWAGFVEMNPAASMNLGLGSRFDMDLALHVA
jgi:hypothetical protein